MKAAEPRRLTYGRASRRSTAAAAAGAADEPWCSRPRRLRRPPGGKALNTLRKRGSRRPTFVSRDPHVACSRAA